MYICIYIICMYIICRFQFFGFCCPAQVLPEVMEALKEAGATKVRHPGDWRIYGSSMVEICLKYVNGHFRIPKWRYLPFTRPM